MKHTPYYRSPTSIVSFLAGGAVGVTAATLFAPPPGRTRRVKIGRKVQAVDDVALDVKRSKS